MSSVSARIRNARSGDDAALETLLESYRGLLKGVARPALGNLPGAGVDASDVVQETLLKAHRNFSRFRGDSEGEFVGWLKSILARTVGDAGRGLHGRGAKPLPRQRSLEAMIDRSSHALSELVAATGTSPSQHATAGERSRALAAALERLPGEQREAIVLRTLQGLDWAEVGARLGRSPDAARMLWGRALRGLGRLMNGWQ